MRSTQWGLLKGQLEKLLRKLWIDLTVACTSCKLDGYYPNYPIYYCGQYRQRRASLFLISQAGLHSLQAPSVPNDLGIKWFVFRCGWGRPNGGGVQGCVKEKREGEEGNGETLRGKDNTHTATRSLTHAHQSQTNVLLIQTNRLCKRGSVQPNPSIWQFMPCAHAEKSGIFTQYTGATLTLPYPVLLDDFKKARSTLLNKNINNRIETCSWSVQRTRQTACAS